MNPCQNQFCFLLQSGEIFTHTEVSLYGSSSSLSTLPAKGITLLIYNCIKQQSGSVSYAACCQLCKNTIQSGITAISINSTDKLHEHGQSETHTLCFKKKFTLFLFAITKSDADRFQ